MANGSSFQDEISEMIAERQAKLREFAGQVEAIQREIEALREVAQLYRSRHALPEPISPSELRGETQLDALIYLCHKQGQFAVIEAKRLMREAGILTRGKNADSILYTLIRRSDRFEKVRPGVYKLRSLAGTATATATPAPTPRPIRETA